jgi:hypothetical protein
MIYDRATIVTTTVMTIIGSSAPKAELQRQIENVLRDEIAGIEHQIAADILVSH